MTRYPLKNRLAYKIWLAFFLVLFISVLSIALVMGYNLKREFYQYASAQALEGVKRLEWMVALVYEKTGSLEDIGQTPAFWDRTKHRAFHLRKGFGKKGPPRAHPPPPRPPPSARPKKPLKDHPHFKDFVDSVILVGLDKQLIAGVKQERVTYTWHKVSVNDTPVGYIGYIIPKRHLLRAGDFEFINKHLLHLFYMALISMALSVGVAYWVSRKISTPIRQLSEFTGILSSGDYGVRIQARTSDEIGTLCKNFNHLAQALESNTKLKAQWVSDISHEMRTPVSVLKAQIEAMQDGIYPADEKGLNLLHIKVQSLSTVINDLFELSLSDVGALSYKKEDIDLKDFIDTRVESFKPKTVDADLQLNITNSIENNTKIFGDKNRLDQLFSNVLENSVRYTSAGGSIQITALEEEDTVTLCVEDSAPGLTGDEHQKIFDRLYRAEQSRSRELGGAGLGLALCKNIVEAHQGEIWAQASDLGGVATIIRLPKSV